MPYAPIQISIPLRCRKDRLSTKPSELGFKESTFRHITQVLQGSSLGIVSLLLALPACYFPCPLSISGELVNLEMSLLISPDHFENAVVTVTAHAPSNIGVEDLFGLLTNVEEDGCDSIVTGAERRESHSC